MHRARMAAPVIFALLLSLPVLAQLPVSPISVSLDETRTYPAARIGLNVGYNDFYEDYLLKNWAGINPGFQPQIWAQSISVAATGSASTFTGDNVYDQVTPDWWPANHGAFAVVYGENSGCKGVITANTVANQVNAGVTYRVSPACPHPFSPFDVVNIFAPPVATPPAEIDRGSLGWRVSVSGAGSIVADTALGDLPPAIDGFRPFQVLKLANPGGLGSVGLSTNFDSASKRLYYNATGTVTDSLMIDVLQGSPTFTFAVARQAPGGFSNSQTVVPTAGWHTYSTTFTPNESTSQAPGVINISYTMHGAGTALIINAQVSENNDNNGTVFRNQVSKDFAGMHLGECRFWEQQNGETLANWITPQGYRSPAQASGGEPYSDIYPLHLGLHDSLVFAASYCGGQVWIETPLAWSNADAANLADYLGGGPRTAYGAKRIALGQTIPWTNVFKRIVIEKGNEVWNAAGQNQFIPFGGKALWAYLPIVIDWCTAAKADENWKSSVEKCAATIQTGNAYWAQQLEAQDPHHAVDVQANNEYGGYLITTPGGDSPWISSWTEAWAAANDCAKSAYCQTFAQAPQTGQYEYQHGALASGSTMTQAQANGFAEGEGYGLVDILSALWVGEKFGSLDHDFFTYSQPRIRSPAGILEGIWGIKTGLGGAYNNLRPAGYAITLVNDCMGDGLGYAATVNNGPVYNFSGYNGVAPEANVPYLSVFPFKDHNRRCILVVNTDPVHSYVVAFHGSNPPSGQVTGRLYYSKNLTDNNEDGEVVHLRGVTAKDPPSFEIPPHSASAISYSVHPGVAGGTARSSSNRRVAVATQSRRAAGAP